MRPKTVLNPSAIRRRPGGRSARNAQALMDAAMSIMQSDNRIPTVDELARRVGIQKSSIYRRWGTAERIVLEAVQDRLESTLPIPNTGSTRRDLKSFLDANLAFHLSPMGAMLTRLVVSTSDEFKTEYWPERLEAASKIVERGQMRGEIKPGIDTHAAIEMLISPFYFRSVITSEALNSFMVEDALQIIDSIFTD